MNADLIDKNRNKAPLKFQAMIPEITANECSMAYTVNLNALLKISTSFQRVVEDVVQ